MKNETLRSLLVLWFGSILMLGVGCGATYWFSYISFVEKDEVALQHETWTQVPAHVLQCRVHRSAARYRNQSTHEWLQVRYSYVVDGIRFESDEVGSMDKDRLPMFKEASEKCYSSMGDPSFYLPSDLCCYVNPNNPRDVKLFTDVKTGPWWWICFLLVFWSCVALGGLLVLIWSTAELGRRIGRFFRKLFGK